MKLEFEKMKNVLEHSRENNDLLKRMSKIIVDKFKNKNKSPELMQIRQEMPPTPTKKPMIEVSESDYVTISDVDEEGEQFTEHIFNDKRRGFKRSQPNQQKNRSRQVKQYLFLM